MPAGPVVPPTTQVPLPRRPPKSRFGWPPCHRRWSWSAPRPPTRRRRSRAQHRARCRRSCSTPATAAIDPGAIGVNGIYEKTVTLAMARELQRGARGERALSCDPDPRRTTASCRCASASSAARDGRGALFVSLHADALGACQHPRRLGLHAVGNGIRRRGRPVAAQGEQGRHHHRRRSAQPRSRRDQHPDRSGPARHQEQIDRVRRHAGRPSWPR